MKKDSSSFGDLFQSHDQTGRFAELVENTLSVDQLEAIAAEKFAGLTDGDGSRKASPSARRQTFSPQDRIDLHGQTEEEALRNTAYFIQNCRQRGLRQVLVITGKGLHSEGDAVLPGAIEGALYVMKQSGRIHAYDWEKGERSRSGALIVTLVP